MAWPYDARYTDFAALTRVPSACLNSIQDYIKTLYGGTTNRFAVNGISENAAGQTYPQWRRDPGGLGWIAVVTGLGKLSIPLVMPVATIVTSVQVKWFIAAAAGMTAELYAVTHNMGTSATAPARAKVGDTITSAAGTPPDWRVPVEATWASLTEAIDPATKYLEVVFENADAGDIVAGVRYTT
jgi:hypothetical protein